jgi:hypothetical protein
MRAGVGYSEQPDTARAGREAALEAMRQGAEIGTCDLALLFATAQHDARALRAAVASVVGVSVPIVGGGAVGVISNAHFGYAGNQVGVACLWLKTIRCDTVFEGDLVKGELDAGRRLGQKLLARGLTPASQVLLFYDSLDHGKDGVRMLMATELLKGMEQSMGFLPNMAGAGMQGDYACTAFRQWAGADIVRHHALVVAFSGDLRMDTEIIHGCRPGSGYHTVTRAERQTVLEIDGQPALRFMRAAIGSAVLPADYPFFLTLGRNLGDKWGDFDEDAYANHLCLAVDEEKEGIVMFESVLEAGTEFQIMYRNLELDYIAPKVERCFARIEGRKAVLALYINCAGRAAGYAGSDLEDALVLQKLVEDRVPLLGMYTGVEIAPVRGRPSGLDWTGVFCLLSVADEQ